MQETESLQSHALSLKLAILVVKKSVLEIKLAERFLCQQTQSEAFVEEIRFLREETKIHQLSSRWSQDELIRVAGRITQPNVCLPRPVDQLFCFKNIHLHNKYFATSRLKFKI